MFRCEYLNSEYENSYNMLQPCVQDSSKGGGCNVHSKQFKDNLMNSLAIQRDHEKGIEEGSASALKERSLYDNQGQRHQTISRQSHDHDNIISSNHHSVNMFGSHEGFTNFYTDNGPGESTIQKGECPLGYQRCLKSGKCIQKCIGCKLKDQVKSHSFNTADPCFPEGVFNGFTNDGYVKCTCGQDNQYCPDVNKPSYSTDGLLQLGRQLATVGNSNALSKLFLFDQL